MTLHGYNIVADVEGGRCSQEELKELDRLADEFLIENDGDGNYYVYSTKAFNQFVEAIKTKRIGGRIFLYEGDYPDYEWRLTDTLEF